MLLEKSHDDRCGYIVWKIRNHLDRPAAISLLHDLVDIHLQYVIVDDGHIVVLRKGLVQNREKILVYLHRHNLSGTLRKILGHGSYSRAYLQNAVVLRDVRRADYLVYDMGIYEEILTELLLKCKFVFLYRLYRDLWIT